MIFSTVLAAICAGCWAAEDVVFPQDVPHRSTYRDQEEVAQWESLPFGALSRHSSLHVGQCFIALWDGKLYSSARNVLKKRATLDSPYQPWTLMVWEEPAPNSLSLIESKSPLFSFFVLSTNGLRGVSLSSNSQCESVEVTKDVYLADSELWSGNSKATSSSDFVWISNTAQSSVEYSISQVSLIDFTMTTMPLDEAATSIFYSDIWEKLFVGTDVRLLTYSFDNKTVTSKDHEWIGGVIDTAPLDMSYDDVNDALWIAQKNSIHKMLANGMILRYGQRQGSPNSQITSVKACNGFVWVGSTVGLARVRGDSDAGTYYKLSTDKIDGEDPWQWNFYGGHRHLPDNNVVGIQSSLYQTDSSAVLVICSTGLSLVDVSLWNLDEKARAVETFQNPRHNRHGLTTGVNLKVYGDLESYSQRCDDNDGLWTSMTGMGQVYRYLVTGEEAARHEAWDNFKAIEMLSILPNDYPHFPARSFATFEEAETLSGCSGDPWVNSTVVDGYVWKSTTSSDEIDGHLAFLPLVYDHIAKTQEEKDRAYNLIEGITGGILKNDLYLIDPSTGQPTHWGFWNPDLVNDDPSHYSERGTNSIGILGYLASAYSITKDVKYKTAFWNLAIGKGYIKNCLNGKIDNPTEDNHSDNELLFQAYHILFYAYQRLSETDEVREEVHDMVEALVPGLQRFWSIVKGEMSPLWLGIYAGTCGQPVSEKDVSDATWTLRHWPIDFIQWEIDNTQRWDITESPFYARDHEDEPLMRQIRPPNERPSHKWNSDPFVLTADNGMSEEMPSIWALPYWLMRHNGLISGPK